MIKSSTILKTTEGKEIYVEAFRGSSPVQIRHGGELIYVFFYCIKENRNVLRDIWTLVYGSEEAKNLLEQFNEWWNA